MNNDLLCLALSDVCESRLLSEPDCTAIPDSYEFSADFENRMGKLGLGQRTDISKRPSVRKRIRIALFAAVIFAAGFCLGMGRMPLWNFIQSSSDSGRIISFDIENAGEPKRHIDDIYTITPPEGFERVLGEWSSRSAYEIWENKETGRMIYLGHYLPGSFKDVPLYDEGEYYIDEDDTQYYITEGDGYTDVLWYNGSYVMNLCSNLSTSECLELCKTLKNREN
ncbi:MAG: hypothetical protein IKO44_00525 [Ruminococcus sp.]|nr:hypothetical protein [Ruminococcus sp.]